MLEYGRILREVLPVWGFCMHLSGRSLKLPNLRNLVHDSWTAFTALPKQDQLGIVIILAFAMLGPLLDLGGWDFFQAFRRDTLSGNYGFKTWHPYPIYWLIYPFAILPAKIGFLVWNLASAVCFVVAIRLWNGRYLNFALSLPLFWMFYAGQIDGFIALGLALAVLANPYVAGVGLVLLTIKPQVGFLPILFVLFHRRDWRMLVVPSVVFVLSLAQWGWWIPEWIASILEIEKADEVTNITLYPYSLLLLPLLWFKRSSLNVYYLVGSLLAPVLRGLLSGFFILPLFSSVGESAYLGNVFVANLGRLSSRLFNSSCTFAVSSLF